jgi:hypothetical protein
MTAPTLAALIWQAVTAPAETDRGALLKLASDFLDAAAPKLLRVPCSIAGG